MFLLLTRYQKTIILIVFFVLGLVGFTIYKRNSHVSVHTYRLPIENASSSFENEFKAAQKLVDGDPKNIQPLNQLAELYYVRGRRTGDANDFSESRRLAEVSLKLTSVNNSQAQLILAKVASTQHRFNEAISIAQSLLGEKGTKASAFEVLISSYVAIGELSKASEAADVAVVQNPRIRNLALRSLVLFAQGRDEEAVFDLEKGFAVEDLGEGPDSAWARCLLASH